MALGFPQRGSCGVNEHQRDMSCCSRKEYNSTSSGWFVLKKPLGDNMDKQCDCQLEEENWKTRLSLCVARNDLRTKRNKKERHTGFVLFLRGLSKQRKNNKIDKLESGMC